jgi:hypothetical protein
VSGVVWCGVVCGVWCLVCGVWCVVSGVVWCGVVWCDVVRGAWRGCTVGEGIEINNYIKIYIKTI